LTKIRREKQELSRAILLGKGDADAKKALVTMRHPYATEKKEQGRKKEEKRK